MRVDYLGVTPQVFWSG